MNLAMPQGVSEYGRGKKKKPYEANDVAASIGTWGHREKPRTSGAAR